MKEWPQWPVPRNTRESRHLGPLGLIGFIPTPQCYHNDNQLTTASL